MRFVVISYCEDQDQVFHDVVEARNEANARRFAARVRGEYAKIADVMTLDTFQGMSQSMSNYGGSDVIQWHNTERLRKEYL